MADEPSWDEIFTGTIRGDGAAGTADSGAREGSAAPAAPMSRRELRLRREEEERRRGRSAKPTREERAQARGVTSAPQPTPVPEPEARSAAQQAPSAAQQVPSAAPQAPSAAPQAPTAAAQAATAAQQAEAAQQERAARQLAALQQARAAQEAPAHDVPAAQTPEPAHPVDALFAGEAHRVPTTTAPIAHQAARGTRPTKTKPVRVSRWRKPGTWILIGVLVVVLGGGTYGVSTLWSQYASPVAALFGGKSSDDYTGSGNGTKVEFTIVSGDIGSTIASKLAKAGITKSADAPYQILLANTTISFQPGTYSMYEHMSAQSAIDRLQDSSARITTKLVIPEGTTLKGIISLMATATKIPKATIQKAAADYTAFGLPSNATSLEGYLFPATYDLEPNKTAHQYLQDMVDITEARLTSAGVPKSKWEHTIIFASLIQKEAGKAADFPKVARVFQNRIDQGMLLQSDATVAYGAGTTDRVTTTDAERADASNKYNTYVHAGLPVGPISNPGDVAIKAAVKPATGSWLYFVTVNLDTGETVFSTTYAEHQAAVAQFQAWLRAHPEYQ